ncbi:MAG: tripartite tricarboxylate transporter substrate binding protein [Betaproteobacteria bacterium]|nr:tripartite tricarboxylate transporter substrate binding protein [Betaproteobacteria bacterium]
MKTTYRLLSLICAFALALACGGSLAQGYPNKPIKLVVGYAPGGGTDILARMIGQKLSEQLGRSVVVENKPGADAAIGAEYVAKSPPDGYTFFVGTSAEMVFNSCLNPRLPYDPVRDFVPVIHLSRTPMIFAVNHAFPANSMKELVAAARAKPGGVFYSSGTAHFRVGAELFNKQAGIKIVHVPYKGSGPAVNAAVAGEVSVVVTSVASSMAQLKAGKLRALAVTSSKRSVFLPDVPTLPESNLDFEVGEGVPSWTGLFAPAGTPGAIIDKLYNEALAALKSDSIKERFATLGYEMSGASPAELSVAHKAELAKWTKIVRDLGLRSE